MKLAIMFHDLCSIKNLIQNANVSFANWINYNQHKTRTVVFKKGREGGGGRGDTLLMLTPILKKKEKVRKRQMDQFLP